jgi:hypothetical protein
MSLVKAGQKSVRVVLSLEMYNRVKSQCDEHGDISRLIRSLIRKHFAGLDKGDEEHEQIALKRD